MVNAWDFVFGAFLLFSAWLGWKLKSLPLLGAGFAVTLAPLMAENAGWLVLTLSAALLMLLFMSMSKMLATLKLEFLDRGFGAALCAGIFISLLSLNVGSLEKEVIGNARRNLLKSWTWKHLRVSKEPAWVEALEQKVEKLKLPQKP